MHWSNTYYTLSKIPQLIKSVLISDNFSFTFVENRFCKIPPKSENTLAPSFNNITPLLPKQPQNQPISYITFGRLLFVGLLNKRN